MGSFKIFNDTTLGPEHTVFLATPDLVHAYTKLMRPTGDIPVSKLRDFACFIARGCNTIGYAATKARSNAVLQGDNTTLIIAKVTDDDFRKLTEGTIRVPVVALRAG